MKTPVRRRGCSTQLVAAMLSGLLPAGALPVFVYGQATAVAAPTATASAPAPTITLSAMTLAPDASLTAFSPLRISALNEIDAPAFRLTESASLNLTTPPRAFEAFSSPRTTAQSAAALSAVPPPATPSSARRPYAPSSSFPLSEAMVSDGDARSSHRSLGPAVRRRAPNAGVRALADIGARLSAAVEPAGGLMARQTLDSFYLRGRTFSASAAEPVNAASGTSRLTRSRKGASWKRASSGADLEAFAQLGKQLFHPNLRSPDQNAAVLSHLPKIGPNGLPTDDELNRDVARSPLTNPEREQVAVKLLQAGGAADETVTLEPGRAVPLDRYDTVMLQDAGQSRRNIIVVKNGRTNRIVVVSAHHDKVRVGRGTIDNWTGTTMAANLYKAMHGLDTEATFVFLLCAREEEGLLGSEFFLDSLSDEQKKLIDADVNLDTLGVNATLSWQNNSDRPLLEAVMETAKQENLDLREVRFEGGDADSSSFRKRQIPAITIFGATEDRIWDIIHTDNDTIEAFSFPHYKNAYLLTLAFLKRLDQKPVRAPMARRTAASSLSTRSVSGSRPARTPTARRARRNERRGTTHAADRT